MTVPHRKLVVPLVALLVLVGVVTTVVLSKWAATDAASEAAERYVDLVATGDEDDLTELWAMTASEQLGALRTSGQLLTQAEERIDVVSVGEAESVDTADVPHPSDFEDFVEVEVTYRLADQEHRWALTLGSIASEDGRDAEDWRVLTPMTGSLEWEESGDAGVPTDYYVSSSRQVRRPALGGSDEVVQPLYPAVYSAQRRADPYFASEEEPVDVTAGDPVAAPDLELEPTARTRQRIRQQVWAAFEDCTGGDSLRRCPARDLAEESGVDDSLYPADWWMGLTDRPRISFDGARVKLSRGAFRLRTPRGVQRMEFVGTADYVLDNQSWTPVLIDVELEDTR